MPADPDAALVDRVRRLAEIDLLDHDVNGDRKARAIIDAVRAADAGSSRATLLDAMERAVAAFPPLEPSVHAAWVAPILSAAPGMGRPRLARLIDSTMANLRDGIIAACMASDFGTVRALSQALPVLTKLRDIVERDV